MFAKGPRTLPSYHGTAGGSRRPSLRILLIIAGVLGVAFLSLRLTVGSSRGNGDAPPIFGHQKHEVNHAQRVRALATPTGHCPHHCPHQTGQTAGPVTAGDVR